MEHFRLDLTVSESFDMKNEIVIYYLQNLLDSLSTTEVSVTSRSSPVAAAVEDGKVSLPVEETLDSPK